MAREIVKEDGFGRNGLLGKGITGTMARNGYFNMVKNVCWSQLKPSQVYFGFYHTVKNWVPMSQDYRLEFLRKVRRRPKRFYVHSSSRLELV